LKTTPVFLPILLFLEAAAYACAKRPEPGLVSLDEALKLAEPGSSLTAMFCRLQGELLLAVSHDKLAEAEAWSQR
jgi:hypothetical protein